MRSLMKQQCKYSRAICGQLSVVSNAAGKPDRRLLIADRLQIGPTIIFEAVDEDVPGNVDHPIVAAVGRLADGVPAPGVVELDAPFTLILVHINDRVGVRADDAILLVNRLAVVVLAEVRRARSEY